MSEPTQSAAKMNTNWTPDKVKKVAIKNQKWQQTTRFTLVTPKKGTNCVKKETPRKRTRTPKKSPGEEFSQGSKQAALQSSSHFDANRSFLTIDSASILQSENAKQFNIDSDSSSNCKIITSNDPSLLMSTSINSPPIGSENTIDKQTCVSYKSTFKIEKAMVKIKATKQNIPSVVFLDNQVEDKSKNTKTQDNEVATIEIEQERIRLEQANIISIIPANTNTSNQLDRNNKDTTQDQLKSQQNILQQQDNTHQQYHLQQQDNAPPVFITPAQSLRSSTTSQEYKTPPVSPEIDISDLNSADIKELDETL